MSNKKISQLTELTTPAADDVLPLVDISTSETKKAQLGNLPISSATQTALDAKQDSLGFTPVPTTRTLTINGTTQDLSANRTFTIATGLTVGTTPISSGTIGRVLFQGTGNVLQQSSSLFWDSTNNRLGIGTSTPNSALEVVEPNSGAYIAAARFLVPNNNVAGRVSQFYLGTAMTTLNSIAWSFHYQGNGSTANYQSFGFNGIATPALTMFGTLNVGINTTTDAGFKLDVNGTARVQGDLTFSGSRTIWFNGTGFGSNIYSNGYDMWYSTRQEAKHHRFQIGGAEVFRIAQYSATDTRITIGSVVGGYASAILSADSTTQGFLPPRMTTTQKNAIASPVAGLQVFDTTLNQMSYYNGTTWTNI